MALRQDSMTTARVSDRWLAPVLVAIAGVGWWWSVVTTRDMSSGMDMNGAMVAMSLAAFLVAWVAMMAAMMLPAVLPVVRLYARAAARGTVAPVAVFLAGYGAVWSAMGLPVFFLWKRLDQPLADATPTAGRIAGVVLVAAAVYQLSPLKGVCLRHCRSPLGFFMQHARNLHRPTGALAVGARHGLYCLGCCWMLMAVLVAFGTMQLAWMAGLALLILVEKSTPIGERVAAVAGVAFLVLGMLLLVHPATIAGLT
jgi:predicted metal-binding membrane protein